MSVAEQRRAQALEQRNRQAQWEEEQRARRAALFIPDDTPTDTKQAARRGRKARK